MSRNTRAAAMATAVALVAVLLVAAVPPLKLVALIIVMLPLALIDQFGLINVGSLTTGFFVPNDTGYLIAGTGYWLALFFSFRAAGSSPDEDDA